MAAELIDSCARVSLPATDLAQVVGPHVGDAQRADLGHGAVYVLALLDADHSHPKRDAAPHLDDPALAVVRK